MKIRSPRLLFYDIEVSRDIVAGYGNKWDFKPVKTIRHQELMCFAYKWQGEKKIRYVSRHDFKHYRDFVKALWEVLDEAQIAVAHNGNKFDHKMANRFFVKEGLGPVSPYKSIDTLQVARSTFKFYSNSLQDLCEYLGIGSKRKITYADLEDDFMSDNPTPKTRRLMSEYNKTDVMLLEKLYNVFKPFIKNHPNFGDMVRLDGVCPRCGSNDLDKRGFNDARVPKQRYRCNNCTGWCNEATIKKKGRVVNA